MMHAAGSFLSSLVLVFLALLSRACDHRLPKGSHLLDGTAVAESVIAAKSEQPDADAGAVLGDASLAGKPLRDVPDDTLRAAVLRWSGGLTIEAGVEVDIFEMRLDRPNAKARTRSGTAYRRSGRVDLHVQHEDGRLLPEYYVWRGVRSGETLRFRFGVIELVFRRG